MPDLDVDLAQHRFGLRFTSPEAEAMYRRWRNEQNLHIIRLAGVVSIPPWVAVPWIGHLWIPGLDWFSIFWIAHALVVPLLAVAVLATYTRMNRYATLLASVNLAVAGATLLWITLVALPAVGVEPWSSAAAQTVFIASFALFLRLPPVMAILSIAPFMIGCAAFFVRLYWTDASVGVDAAGCVTALQNAYFCIVVMSVVNERFFRRAFTNEQMLARQQISLQHSRNLIRRYVPQALVEQIIDGKIDKVEAPERRRITILFSDIVGFTEVADRVEPEVITQMIGEYMAAMGGIVDAHEGTVNEFVGDGLMALFGAPRMLDPERQARNAVLAAQAMQSKLPELNVRWRKLGSGAPLMIRIGIHTGIVSVGSYGSEGRMTYTAIGLQTNIAARIQSHCDPGSILVSDATWQLIQNEVEFVSRGEVQCKGVHFPVAVYSPALTGNLA